MNDIIDAITKKPHNIGVMHIDSPFLLPILKALPKTTLHLFNHDSITKLDSISEFINRVKLVSWKDGFPKYLTSKSPLRSFYDYAIVDELVEKTKISQTIWPRINIGGVLIKCKMDGTIDVRYKSKWVIVIGCCRGGTKYISNIIRATKKLSLHHQLYNQDGIVDGKATGIIAPKDSVFIHQVRNPLGVIASSSMRARRFAPYCEPLMDYALDGNDLLWAMNYWYRWNRLADTKATWTYRVENLTNDWNTLCDNVGIEKCVMPVLSNSQNSDKWKPTYPHITWNTLYALDADLTDKIKELAIRYGYAISPNDSS